MADEHENPTNRPGQPPASGAPEFYTWWPQTKPGRDIWTLLLVLVALASAIVEYRRERIDLAYMNAEEFCGLVVATAIGVGCWYVILVLVRYVACWIQKSARPRP